ncbi:MAG TPA: ImmA/IrrE family metallo-endopeptidase [Azospirillaceae bacterium]|nr:ImmA/IrrE family metallo-endopeptidase [Azospirillaceae bacterium]HRQ81035.1 ImmA/IrrE family metallo-endopeptidase [Azospirillaceae bacterium]
MEIHPIRNDADYRKALRQIDGLMDAGAGTQDADLLEVLSTLVEDYETRHFPLEAPSPVDAIRFRMEQEGLAPRDLIPYIGSRAKVSEVLSGKQPLTLSMIRALRDGLGIPADILLGQSGATLPDIVESPDWGRYPLAAMAKLGWISDGVRSVKDRAEEIMRGMIARAGGGQQGNLVPLYRKNDQTYRNSKADNFALHAWRLELLGRARSRSLPRSYRPGSIDLALMSELARFSRFQKGPMQAQGFLAHHGVHLVILAHLPRTYLDGAAMLADDGTPVIGLTLRYDRTDSFWFSLMHELAHVALHLDEQRASCFDDFDLKDGDEIEKEADEMAQNALIPPEEWETSGVLDNPTPSAVMELAQRLKINPAIVAGRVRRETGNYRLLSQFVGSGEVRPLFKKENPTAWK